MLIASKLVSEWIRPFKVAAVTCGSHALTERQRIAEEQQSYKSPRLGLDAVEDRPGRCVLHALERGSFPLNVPEPPRVDRVCKAVVLREVATWIAVVDDTDTCRVGVVREDGRAVIALGPEQELIREAAQPMNSRQVERGEQAFADDQACQKPGEDERQPGAPGLGFRGDFHPSTAM
jgi:hypothetical protein